MTLSQQTFQGAALSGAFSASAVEGMANEEWLLLIPHLSRNTLVKSARRLENLTHNRKTYAQILEEEKRAGQGIILKLIRSGDFRPLYVVYGCGPEPCNVSEEQYEQDLNAVSPLLKMKLSWMNKPGLLSEYTRCMDWQISEAKKPYQKTPLKFPFPDADEGIEYLIYPNYTTSDTLLRRETATALTMTMLAIRAFYCDKGHYPSRLQELTPKYLTRVPKDPFTDGQPLNYKRQPVKFQKGVVSSLSTAEIRRLYALRAASDVNEPSAAVRSAPSWPIATIRTDEIPATIPFTLYSVGLDGDDNGGLPFRIERKTPPQKYNTYRMERNSAQDFVAGINY